MAVEIPEWVYYIGTAIGAAGAVIATRLGMTNAPKPTSEVQLAGGIFDKKDVQNITQTLTECTNKLIEIHEERIEMDRDTLEAIRGHSREVETLHKEVRELTREIIAASRSSRT